MIGDFATIRLELDSRPESLTVIRGMLAGVGELLEFDSELSDDLKTAVSEACNNVVLHAYRGDPGPLAVEVAVAKNSIEVSVRDRGVGIQDRSPQHDRMGVGLALIRALADQAEVLVPPDGGTEVRMSFTMIRDVLAPPAELAQTRSTEPQSIELLGDVVATLAPVGLLAAVLGRLARALAATARFSLDRFSDLYLITDTIASHAQQTAERGYINFAITATNKRLKLTIGPLQKGSSEQLQADPAGGRGDSPVALLVDELTIQPSDRFETLHLTLLDRRGQEIQATG